MAPRPGFFAYVSAAFKWHWNLLAVGAAAGFSVLSGRPDVFMPLVAAGEILYLGMLSTHPRFRRAIDARFVETTDRVSSEQQLQQIMDELPRAGLNRFTALKRRCEELSALARQLRGAASDRSYDELHLEALNRLLWTFLRLLHGRDALAKFLASTDRSELTEDAEHTRKQLESLQAEGKRPELCRSLEDKLKTVSQRLANYDAAAENGELIDAELDRIEQKIAAVGELAIGARDPAALGAQVDGISDSLTATTEAIRRLDVVPVLDNSAAPAFLEKATETA